MARKKRATKKQGTRLSEATAEQLARELAKRNRARKKRGKPPILPDNDRRAVKLVISANGKETFFDSRGRITKRPAHFQILNSKGKPYKKPPKVFVDAERLRAEVKREGKKAAKTLGVEPEFKKNLDKLKRFKKKRKAVKATAQQTRTKSTIKSYKTKRGTIYLRTHSYSFNGKNDDASYAAIARQLHTIDKRNNGVLIIVTAQLRNRIGSNEPGQRGVYTFKLFGGADTDKGRTIYSTPRWIKDHFGSLDLEVVIPQIAEGSDIVREKKSGRLKIQRIIINERVAT